MAKVIVEKWDGSLAVRLPRDVAIAAGPAEGESVEIEAVDGTIVIRCNDPKSEARRKAQHAVAEILDAGKGMSLGGLSIRELIDEGRR